MWDGRWHKLVEKVHRIQLQFRVPRFPFPEYSEAPPRLLGNDVYIPMMRNRKKPLRLQSYPQGVDSQNRQGQGR